MKRGKLLFATSLAAALVSPALAESEVGADFFWPEAREIAIARSAAPETVSENASYWVLLPSGYRQVVTGSNGFNCLVLRQWSAAFDTQRELFEWEGLVAPICYDPVTSASSMQEQFLRAELGLAGADHDAIRAEIMSAYGDGRLRPLERTAFSYMYSGAQRLTPNAGHWHPHLMVHAPYYTNDMLGGNSFTSGDPVVFEAPGTFRAIIAIPVNGRDGHIQPQFEE
ncbi:hypothetical protein [Parasphingopyxis sp.]|uniref:hypothetical protein n=1 Tax=Parasphingopyxis sp. TaxID=1920299 RepID=UPI002633865F|nr:hypothetical protein [Parasphingopyxis sp.]